jgi:hypothetical protein
MVLGARAALIAAMRACDRRRPAAIFTNAGAAGASDKHGRLRCRISLSGGPQGPSEQTAPHGITAHTKMNDSGQNAQKITNGQGSYCQLSVMA